MARLNLWDALARNELQTVIHEDIRRLPQAYEIPAALWDPQGRSHEVAAPSLQWPSGSVNGRWARAPRVLRARLQIRELTIPTAVYLVAHSPDLVVPEALIRSTVEAAMRLRRARRERSRPT
jgi:hypothetical protein